MVVRIDHQLGRALRSAIDVLTAQLVDFAISPCPLEIPINLIRRNNNCRDRTIGATKSFQTPAVPMTFTSRVSNGLL